MYHIYFIFHNEWWGEDNHAWLLEEYIYESDEKDSFQQKKVFNKITNISKIRLIGIIEFSNIQHLKKKSKKINK